MSDIQKLARPEIQDLSPYQSARMFLHSGDDAVLLNANENPWAPYPGDDNAKGVNRYSTQQPASLISRLSAIYGVSGEQIMATRGSSEGIDLLVRVFCRPAQDAIVISTPTFELYEIAAKIQGAAVIDVQLEGDGFAVNADLVKSVANNEAASIKLVFVCNPNNPTSTGVPQEKIIDLVESLPSQIIVVDEAYIEMSSQESLATMTMQYPNLVVLRTLSKVYGLAGERLGAVVAHPDVIDLLRRVLAVYPLPVSSVRTAEKALSAHGLLVTQKRLMILKNERQRLMQMLEKCDLVEKIWKSETNFLFLALKDHKTFMDTMIKHNIVVRDRSKEMRNTVRLTVGSPEENDVVLAALGLIEDVRKTARVAMASRTTKETDILVDIDLDKTGIVEIDTGIGFYDHMLEQLAKHGGFSLVLRCRGDLHIDAHHTVEDCALALGQALKEALGNKKGIGRYGFVLPMDEAESIVSIDLSGRPACVFKGTFPESMLGTLPTEMIPHFFESLAQTLGAAIHVEIKGDNTHHMVESAFKGLAKCFGQAFAVNGDELPSTKGVL